MNIKHEQNLVWLVMTEETKATEIIIFELKCRDQLVKYGPHSP